MRMLQVPVRDMAPIQGTVPESALKAAVQHRQTDITLQAQSRLQEIRRFIFSGFQKGCYKLAKFDSDTERRMALILEQDPTVLLWMKPGPNQFKIFDSDGSAYQPDFVVETNTEKLIIETKRDSEMTDATVLRKADAASLWCYIATEAHGKKVGDKPWAYLLIPEAAVQNNATVTGLAATYCRSVDADLLSRYSANE